MTRLVAGLARAADRFADRPALTGGGRDFTYSSLVAMVGRCATLLRARGVVPGARVALVLENSWQYVVAFYGTLWAGGIVVPLNSAAKGRDLSNWLADAQPRCVIIDAGHPAVEELKTRWSADADFLRSGAASGDDGLEALLGNITDAPPAVEADDSACACILYTSGTTGRPKGVMLSQANLASNADAIIQYLALTEKDSTVAVLPFYYSYGNSVLHSHLRAGARLVLQNRFVYPHAIVELLARERATGFAGVPSTFALLLDRVRLQDHALGALRYVTQAGGAMSKSLTLRLQAALPQTRVIVMYGQTEASARLTWLPPDRLAEKLGSVGVAIPGVTLQIRDDAGSVLGAELEGQVWASGPNVMLGYWRNPEATADVLSAGWLRTGDVGRLDREGFLYLAGRRSDIIKVGAHRVHPGDIESVIEELPEVLEAAVVGAEDPILGEQIRALVVPRVGMSIDIQRLKRHCLEQLASYKIPKVIDIVPALPRTPSGKIWRAALTQEKSPPP